MASILKKIVIVCVALFASASAHAQIFDFFGLPFSTVPQQQRRPSQQVQQSSNTSLFYNVLFDYYFDNREYDAGGEKFTNSQTLNSTRLTPQVGIQINQDQRVQHRVVLGMDMMKNMGENPLSPAQQDLQNWKLMREMTMFYSINARAGKNLIEGYAGVFPRRYSGAEWSRAFISDSLKFYDNNLEGILLKISRPRFYFETGLDWNGQYSDYRRESFLFFSEAKFLVADYLEAGLDLNYHHLACSGHIGGVIDNGLVEPFVKFDLSRYLPLDYFTVKAGYYQAFQNDRARFHKYVFPSGGELTLDLMKWNVGIENSTYVGNNLMPYYNDRDVFGNTLGSLLYYGSPLYQNRLSDHNKAIALSDRLEIYYRPHISSFIDLNISCIFDFNGEFSGSRQKFSLFFDLEKLYSKASSRSAYSTKSTSARKQKAERPTPKGLQVL